MKKNLIYLFILLSLTGCGKEKKSSNVTPTKTNTTITLEGNETTGYTWTCTEENNYLKIKSTYQEDTKKDEDITGVGGIYTITLTGVKEGTTELTCQYKRDWEEEAEETRTYPVEIDKNLKVKVGNPTISNNKEATDNTKENAPTQTKELKTFTFNNAYGTETLEAEEALTATGTAGASNIIFYLKENKLYLYGHGEEDELLADGVEKIYYKTKQSEQITVVLNKNTTISKENSYLEYERK
ncbi:MAG: protease inhibitor I42 family protein [Bacilli bacterium]|nr:protease inhibitor I42 family protein [Bacilli bacterium]